jgi:hypothetical protein
MGVREDGACGRPQGGLQFVERLHTQLTSTDTTERDAGMLLVLHRCPARCLVVSAGYWLWRCVALVDG